MYEESGKAQQKKAYSTVPKTFVAACIRLAACQQESACVSTCACYLYRRKGGSRGEVYDELAPVLALIMSLKRTEMIPFVVIALIIAIIKRLRRIKNNNNNK